MENHPSPIGDAIVRMRASAQEDSAHPFLPATLRAAIMAILARPFACLEQVFLAWQSGQLPAAQPRPPAADAREPKHTRRAAPRTNQPRRPGTRRHTRAHQDSVGRCPEPPDPRHLQPTPSPPNTRPHHAGTPARPPDSRRKHRQAESSTHDYFITISN